MDTLEKTFAALYDLSADVVYFPVRHHSPACALHLQKTLEAYKPEAILIEGPSDTGHLIPHLGAGDNKAPICIYYSYRQKATGDEEEFRSACYYPLLDFSPELCALRWGVQQQVDTRFIDLPYSELTLLERGGGEQPQEGKGSYYDDYYLSRSRFIQSLCDKQGCRHYGELWEKLFEIDGLYMEPQQFVRAMLALCHYSRVEYPQELLQREGCLAREAHMAAEIQKARAEHSRVLVITGGFHTAALHALLQGGEIPKLKKQAKGEGAAYLIPYSFAESDQLAGYASGMPYPGFYQQVFENLEGGTDSAYDDAVLLFLARIGGALRKKKESTSIADEVAAVAQSRGLAGLRDKRQQGVYELLDSVRSTYVKGELSASASVMLQTTTELLRGDRMGEVSTGAEQVPLLLDFRETAKKLRLKVGTTARQEITLEILAKPAHRETSAFLHRLDFLKVGFGQLKFGPSYRDRDTARVREKWLYSSGARVEAAIVDVSYLGGTVREAASTALARSRRDHIGCGEYTRLLIDAAVMDLTEHIQPMLEAVEASIAEDGSFASLALAAQNLLFLESARWLLGLPDAGFAARLLQAVYLKAAALLPTLETAQEDEDRELARTLKDLYQVSTREDVDGTVLLEALRELCDRTATAPPPCLQGAAVGLLYAAGEQTVEDVLRYAGGYLYGSGEQIARSGRFLGGLFLTAWDILFAHNGFLDGLGHVLETLPSEEFLMLLPDLRLAFSVFTPTQLDRLGGVVAGMLGIEKLQVTAEAVPEELLALGRALDEYAAQALQGKGESA